VEQSTRTRGSLIDCPRWKQTTSARTKIRVDQTRKGIAGLALDVIQVPCVGLDHYTDAMAVVKHLSPDAKTRRNPSLFLDFHDPNSALDASWKTAVVGTDCYMPLVYPADSNSMTVGATGQGWKPDEIATAIMQRFQYKMSSVNPDDLPEVEHRAHLLNSVARLGLDQFLLPPELT
jgi:hypothetical protein